jgi:N-acetylmuramoyl-L-alanine amidase
MKRVIAHWAVTKYKADDISKQHYHYIYEGDGREVKGLFNPEANLKCANGQYAAHTLNCNTGSIGVSCAAMYGAESVDKPGPFPITAVQFDAMCKGIARLCVKYSIPVTPQTVLSHAEVETTLGIKQRGKWDIAVLPFLNFKTAKACGDEMRKRVQAYAKSP